MNLLLLGFAVLALGLLLWQWIEAVGHPLHRRRGDPDFAPALTLLKPLKGCDAETESCLRSWMRQNYRGPVQILFAVADEADPAVPVVRRLLLEHPALDAGLVICPQRLGPNSKVSKLAQLEPSARHGLLVVSDADVWVPPDFLRELAASFRNAGVGLVNPFYELASPATPAMHGEALAVNADFWSSVLQARRLSGMRFALGAVMAVRREALDRLGGFVTLANHLADDYELGRRVTSLAILPPLSPTEVPASGKPACTPPSETMRIALCPAVVSCRESPRHWQAVWRHQVRWARTIRHCQPLPYAFSLLSNPTLWPLLWLLGAMDTPAILGFGASLAVRMAMAADCQHRLTRSWRHLPWIWLAPLKDLLQCGLWLLAFVGNTVEWRGERYRVLPGGELRPVGNPALSGKLSASAER